MIDHAGYIIAVGSIIQIRSGSDGGARLKAAKELAQYGPSIKISSDGEILGFYIDNKKQGIDKINLNFSIG